MPKYLFVAAAIALATAPAASAAPVAVNRFLAPQVVDVLTTGMPGGDNVAPGTTLQRAAKWESRALFIYGHDKEGELKTSCSGADFSATVKANPPSPGQATAEKVNLAFSGCSPAKGVGSLVADNQKQLMSINGKDNVVTISADSGPIKITATAKVTDTGIETSCTYEAKEIKGTASQGEVSGQKFTGIRFFAQEFKLTDDKGNAKYCGEKAQFSVSYGAVTAFLPDTGGPKFVFVN
jgi:hypothetical protein